MHIAAEQGHIHVLTSILEALLCNATANNNEQVHTTMRSRCGRGIHTDRAQKAR